MRRPLRSSRPWHSDRAEQSVEMRGHEGCCMNCSPQSALCTTRGGQGIDCACLRHHLVALHAAQQLHHRTPRINRHRSDLCGSSIPRREPSGPINSSTKQFQFDRTIATEPWPQRGGSNLANGFAQQLLRVAQVVLRATNKTARVIRRAATESIETISDRSVQVLKNPQCAQAARSGNCNH